MASWLSLPPLALGRAAGADGPGTRENGPDQAVESPEPQPEQLAAVRSQSTWSWFNVVRL